MNKEALRKANDLQREIERIEGFMFWCSGKRDGFRKYPASVIKLKRKWLGGIEAQEYDLSPRLQAAIAECVEHELDLLRKELEGI